MSNGVSVFRADNSLERRGSVAVGESASTEGLSFADKAESYSDLPTTFRTGATESNALVLVKESRERQGSTEVALADPKSIKPPYEVPSHVERTTIAEGVRKLSSNFRSNGRIVQRKVGWLATPSQIFVTTVERELDWVGEKKLRPTGSWLVENRRRWTAIGGTASKRVGKVKEDTSAASAEGPEKRYVESPESIPDAFVAGVNAMSYLPLPVRGDIVSQVPHPNYFDGRLLGVVSPSEELKGYEVNLLRMDDSTAVVISAYKSVDSDEWEVTQARYSLSTPEVESA